MPKNLSTFNQRQLIDTLVKQVGIENYIQVKTNLRIKKPVTEISSQTASRLIQALVDKSKNKKPVVKVKTMELSDVEVAKNALRRLQRKLRYD